MSEFFRTRMGEEFFHGTMPRIATALDKIASELSRTNDLLSMLVVKGMDSPGNWTAEERENALSTVDQLKERLGLRKKRG